MLWDQAIVRNTYKLHADPESFVSYQRYGWKLLHHVTRNKSVDVLKQLEKETTQEQSDTSNPSPWFSTIKLWTLAEMDSEESIPKTNG